MIKKTNKKKITGAIFFGILTIVISIWGMKQLRGHGYYSMVKNYIHYWLNKPDLNQYEPMEKNQAVWLQNSVLLAHAMGGIDNTTYSNSLEAFKQAYENGFRIFEVDFSVTSDNKVVCAHDFSNVENKTMDYDSFMNSKIENKYSPLDVKKMVQLMKQYPDIYIMTDFKWDNSLGSDHKEVITIIEEIVKEAKEQQEELLQRFIVQIYGPDSYEIIEKIYPFEHYVYTLYHYASPIYEEILAFCLEHNIPVVAMGIERINQERTKYFEDWNIDVLVYTVNELEKSKELVDYGVDGIYTDWLLPKDLAE